ncbi:MAG: tRNA dihydrouridine synthase DusB [Steroidobacteraceae bacterium]|nr:tRNA dihydrouridine synthase DusB [Steroidobacteraceae bacterium]
MRIGSWTVAPALALAPMAGVTDRPFRTLCRRLGAGIAASEMVTSDTRLWDSRKSRLRLDHAGEPRPRVVQIAGAEPRTLAEAARLNADLGADIIDINMGCPAKKVCNRAAGSALMRDEPLVREILEAVVGAVDVPVTLKMRTGWDAGRRNAVAVARMAEDIGVAALAVHGRTREQMFEGEAEHETTREVVESVRIPVLANGDIACGRRAAAVLAATGAAGIMIGRGALGRPWVFREIASHLATGRTAEPPSPAEVRAIIVTHLEALHGFYGADQGVRMARKHLAWYAKQLPGAPRPPAELMTTPDAALQLSLADRFLGEATARMAHAA